MGTRNQTHITFNALSVNNHSGFVVLTGHMRSVLEAGLQGLRASLLCHDANAPKFHAEFGDECETILVEGISQSTSQRLLCERTLLKRMARAHGINRLFQPSGYAIPGLGMHQIVLAQNPYPALTELHYTTSDRFKNYILRLLFQATAKSEHAIFFNSPYMKDLYESLARLHLEQIGACCIRVYSGVTRQRKLVMAGVIRTRIGGIRFCSSPQ